MPVNTVQNGKIIKFLAGTSFEAQSGCESCGAPKLTDSVCRACAVQLVDIALSNLTEDTSQEAANPIDTAWEPKLEKRRYYGHYEVCLSTEGTLVELGRGSMGITYKATDLHLGCPVALKIINTQFLTGSSARQRLLREARTAARLRHPNIATVLHLGLEDEQCYFSMELVEGETLDACIRREGAMPLEAALQVALQVARALNVAHRQNFIHRDIKPTNIMLVSGSDIAAGESSVKVIDFGLVKALADEGAYRDLFCRDYFAGTPHYASPEQLQFEQVDARSDIYSLGVCLQYMLAGELPNANVPGKGNKTTISASEGFGGTPSSVIALVKSMTAIDPARRPQTTGELLKRIETCIATVRERDEKAQVNKRKYSQWLWLGCIGFICLAGLEIFLLKSHRMSHFNQQDLAGSTQGNNEARVLTAQADEHLLKQTKADNKLARELFSRAITTDENFANAHGGLAIAHFQNVGRFGAPSTDLDLATEHAQRAISLAPNAPRGYHAQGLIYTLQNRHWEALAQLHKSLELDQTYFPAMRDYGLLWCALGQPQFALPWAKAAMQSDPTSPYAWCVAADACLDLGQDEDAMNYYRRCLEIVPTWKSALCGIMHIHLLESDYLQARKDYQAIESIESGLTLPLNLKAQAELFSGEYGEAEQAYRQLVSKNRSGLVNYYGGISYLSALGYLRYRAGDTQEGFALLEEASTLHNGAEGAHGIYDLAAIRAVQGRKGDAITLLQQAISAGWLDFRSMKLDPRFESIRQVPEFQNMIVTLTNRIDRMRAEAAKLCSQPPVIADYPPRPQDF